MSALAFNSRPHRHRAHAAILCLLCLTLAGCSPKWQTEIVAGDGSRYIVDAATLKELDRFIEEDEGNQGVPLEQVLWTAGYPLIEELTLVRPDGTRNSFGWSASADAGIEWHPDGRLAFHIQTRRIERIEVQAPAILSQVQASITDLAPTAAKALGLPAPAQSTGKALDAPQAEHVLLLFLDGFGYLRYTQALEQGDIPTLSGLGEPLLGLTTYPPVTSVSTGSVLTGAPPQVHGADRRGIRKTEAETILDVAAAAGRTVVAVEGEALAFQLRNAEWQLSGDRDGNGSTDDNVRRNALAVLAQGMPDLLWVHFHGIDDTGHTYGPGIKGPGAPQERAAVREVDAAVGDLLQALPQGTLVLIFADHGMHHGQEEGRLGNHGHLIVEDMLIPIFVWFK